MRVPGNDVVSPERRFEKRRERLRLASVHQHDFLDTGGQSAAIAARSLAIMPALATPDCTMASAPARSRCGSVWPLLSSTPGVAPAITRRRTCRRPARWPANVSALTLNSVPSRPTPMLQTTGR